MVPVFLDIDTARKHFTGFCKQCLFPIFHYYNLYDASAFAETDWQAYRKANEMFANAISSFLQDNLREFPDLICIQDYHLMLMPQLLRERQVNGSIGMFFHVPWPSSEVFRSLAVRKELLTGMLGADLLGK